MFPEKIKINTDDGSDPIFPSMIQVRQNFHDQELENPVSRIKDQLAAFEGKDELRGKRIALTVGSRGIARFALILKTLIDELVHRGATPFIVPSMGSHGGATAEGQKEFIASYGITEETMGVPIISDMAVTLIGETEAGLSVYCDNHVLEADGIIVINKIKPHADFKGDHESGLLKMMAIGLGKQKGAEIIHQLGFHSLASLLPQIGKVFLEKTPILFGVAILENPYDKLFDVEIVDLRNLIEREKELLAIAKKNIARLMFTDIDVLIIDEIGKNISGEGMDPNVTGRPGSGLTEGFSAPNISQIIVLDVTESSHGNGVGIGMADISTLGCFKKLDISAMYTNAVTAAILNPAKIPLLTNNDREAVALALRCSSGAAPEAAKVVRIKNTLEIGTVWISEPLYKTIQDDPSFTVLSGPTPLCFDSEGNLKE